jgi:hypothetical protein
MIAKALKYLFAFGFAAYFLLVGAGYNVVSYCCPDCAKEGIEAVATRSCDAVHHHSHSKSYQHQNKDITCSDSNHHSDRCHLLRLHIDTPSIQVLPNLLNNTISTTILFFPSEILFILKPALAIQYAIPPPYSRSPFSGREIMALHSVLLI